MELGLRHFPCLLPQCYQQESRIGQGKRRLRRRHCEILTDGKEGREVGAAGVECNGTLDDIDQQLGFFLVPHMPVQSHQHLPVVKTGAGAFLDFLGTAHQFQESPHRH